MKEYKKECRSAISMILSFMLVFTMVLGCSDLSASADGTVLPEIVTEPMIGFSTLTEEDLRYNFGSDLTAGSDYNGSYMQALDLGYVSFQFDDTQCDSDHKFASVSSISYKYADAEYSDGTASETGFEISGNALEYGYSEEFGAAVVKFDLKYKLFYKLAGWSEEEFWYSYRIRH